MRTGGCNHRSGLPSPPTWIPTLYPRFCSPHGLAATSCCHNEVPSGFPSQATPFSGPRVLTVALCHGNRTPEGKACWKRSQKSRRSSPSSLSSPPAFPTHQGVLSHLGSGRLKTPQVITAPQDTWAVLELPGLTGTCQLGLSLLQARADSSDHCNNALTRSVRPPS